MQQVVAAPKNDAGPADSPLFVYVAADGVVRLDGSDVLDDGAILAQARSYQESHVRGVAVVRSDPSAIHGRTLRVVALLEEARITSVAFDQMR